MTNAPRLKIALVNRLPFKSRVPHFGLISLAAFIRQRFPDLDIKIIESLDPFNDVLRENPDVVGFTSDTLSFPGTLALAKRLRKHLGVPFVLGGVHITSMPESFDDVFDIAVMGEGELVFSDLLGQFINDAKFTSNNLSKTRGILFRDDGKVISCGRRDYIEDIDILPYPARELVEMEGSYLKNQLNLFGVRRMVAITTSRGCPYDCIFCGSPVQWGRARFHTAGYVVNEVEFLTKIYRLDGIMFWDDLFIAPKKRLEEMVRLIKEKGLDKKLVFFGYARANLINEEVCALLKSINVKRLIFGLESGSERILHRLKGGSVTVSDNERAIRLCRKYGITTSSGFITGTPGENIQDLKDTFNFMVNNPLENSHIYVLTPYPGTKLWNEAKNNQIVGPGMDWAKLYVEFPAVTFFDLFRRNKPGLLDTRVFLNPQYQQNREYTEIIFKMLKLAMRRNLIYYAKMFLSDPALIMRLVRAKTEEIICG